MKNGQGGAIIESSIREHEVFMTSSFLQPKATAFPVEIEIEIVEQALVPSLLYDFHIHPSNITLYYEAIVNANPTILQAILHPTQQYARKFRLVCQRWKHLIDSSSRNVLSSFPGVHTAQNCISTRVATPIDTHWYDVLTFISPNSTIKHSEPIKILRFDYQADRLHSPPLDAMKAAIFHPSHLRALYLSWRSLRADVALFEFLENSFSNLTTLSINIHYASFSGTSLLLPRLKNLFIQLVEFTDNVARLEWKWRFPALKSIALEAHSLITNTSAGDFVMQVINEYKSQLSTLRLPDWSTYHFGSLPSTFWSEFPLLEALITDFNQVHPDESLSPASSSHPIRYLVDLSQPWKSDSNLEGLKVIIALCLRLETVTISDDWLLPTSWIDNRLQLLQGFRAFCRQHGVKIVDIFGRERLDSEIMECLNSNSSGDVLLKPT